MATEEEIAYLRDNFGYFKGPKTPPEDSSAFRRVGDLGVDVAKGAIGLGKAAVGVGNLVTGGALQQGIKDYYRPEEAEQFLSQYYGSERQAEEQKIQESKGFLGRLGAVASEPGALLGRAVQSIPLMLPAAKAMQAAKVAGYGVIGQRAAGAAGEGLTTAAIQGQEVIGNDPENVGGMYLQLPAGAITGAISFGAGKYGGDIEGVLAGRGIGIPGGVGATAARGALAEAGEETFQSMNEQIFMNIAEGRPWNESVLEAGAEGMLVGGAVGGVFGALSPQEAAAAIEQDDTQLPPASPAAPVVNDQPLAPAGMPEPQSQAESPSAVGVVDEVLPPSNEVLAPELDAQPTPTSDLLKGEAPQTLALREIAKQTEARIKRTGDLKNMYTELYTEYHGSAPKKGVVTAAVNRITQGKNSVEEVVAAIDEQLAKPLNNKNYEARELLSLMRARLVPEVQEDVGGKWAEIDAQDEPTREDMLQYAADRVDNDTDLMQILDRLPDPLTVEPFVGNTSRIAWAVMKNKNASDDTRARAQKIYAAATRGTEQVQPTPLPESGAPLAVTEPAQQPGAAAGTTLFGLSGAQIAAMQGGKMTGADQFPGYAPTQEQIVARAKSVEEAKEKEVDALDAASANNTGIAALRNAGLPSNQVLQAADELNSGDDSLMKDLARIHNINLPVAQPATTVAQEATPDVSTKPEKIDTSAERVQETPKNIQDASLEDAAFELLYKASGKISNFADQLRQYEASPNMYQSWLEKSRGKMSAALSAYDSNIWVDVTSATPLVASDDLAIVRKYAVALAETPKNIQEPLARVGTTPKNSQPVTVRDGVIYVGDEPAVNFDTGEDVRATGTSVNEIGTALRAAGVLTSKQKVFGVGKAKVSEIDEARTARASGQTTAAVLQRLRGIFGEVGISRLVSKGVLNVVQTASDLPPALQDQIQPDTRAFYINGKAYMIADRLDAAGVRSAFIHELGEHYGLEDMLGMAKYRELLKIIPDLAGKDGDIGAALVYVQKNYPELADGSQRQAREVLAHLGESAPDHSLWQMIVRAVKTWLLKQGFTKINALTAEELQGLVLQSARRAAAGKVKRYSRNVMFSADVQAGWMASIDNMFVGRTAATFGKYPHLDLGDGNQRGELDSSQADMNISDKRKSDTAFQDYKNERLYVMLHFPELFAAYPALKDLRVTIKLLPKWMRESSNYGEIVRTVGGVSTIYVRGRSLGSIKSNLLHEIQHWVQTAEGWEAGSTPRGVGDEAFKAYRNLFGEREARLVQARVDLSRDERTSNPPQLPEIDEARWSATLPQQIGDTISTFKANVPVQDLWARAKKLGLKGLMLHHIEEIYGDKFRIVKDGKTHRPVKEFIDSLLRMGRARDEMQRQAGAVLQRFSNLSPQSKAKLDYAQANLSLYGFKSKDVLKDGKLVGVEVESWGDMAPEKTKEIWHGLTPKEHLVYAYMRSDLERQHRGLLQATVERLKTLGPKGQSIASDITLSAGTLKGDFFPLDRSGDHTVVWKSKQLQEAEQNEDTALVNLMKTMVESPHYIVERFETLDDAKKFQSELNNKGTLRGDTEEHLSGDALYYKQPEFIAGLDRVPQAFMQRLSDALDVNLDDIEARIQGAKNAGDTIQAEWLEQQKEMAAYNDELKGLVIQMYIRALPEYAAAKRHLHRSGIAGFRTDSAKTFANYSERVSGATAKAQYMQKVLDSLTLAGDAAREAGKAGDPSFQDVVDVLRQHQEAIMNPRHHPGPWQGWLSNAAYIWYLGMTPAFALTNMSQGFLMSAPVVAGRLGVSQLKVQKAIIKAMGDAFGVNKAWIAEAEGNLFKRIYNAKPGYLEVPQIDAEGNPTGLTELKLDLSGTKLSEDEQALVQHLYEQSAIDINQTNDLVTSAEGVPLKMSESMKVLSLFAHHSEVLNRISTGLAAYRMAKEKGGGKDTKGEAITAEEFSEQIINDTHINYMTTNAPLFIKPGYNPIATIMGQFRKYQIGMVFLLGRNMALAIRGAYRVTQGQPRSEAEKIALRTLNGLMMSHLVAAGSLGMPLVGSIAWAVSKMLDDDDDPWDKERVMAEYRNWLAEMMGVDAAEVAAHGVFRLPGVKEVLPSTIGSRVGQQDLLSPLRNMRTSNREMARDTLMKTIGAAMSGPSGGMAGDLLTAWEQMGKGNFDRGVEYATPKFVRDVFKTYRFADEGVTTSRGETRIGPEAFEGMDLFWQSMGFAPSEVVELYAAQGAVQGLSEAVAARRSSLISRHANARMEGDDKEAARVRDDLAEAFNEANPDNPILPKDFISAYRSRIRTQSRINEQGLEENRRRPGEVELGRFANVE